MKCNQGYGVYRIYVPYACTLSKHLTKWKWRTDVYHETKETNKIRYNSLSFTVRTEWWTKILGVFTTKAIWSEKSHPTIIRTHSVSKKKSYTSSMFDTTLKTSIRWQQNHNLFPDHMVLMKLFVTSHHHGESFGRPGFGSNTETRWMRK